MKETGLMFKAPLVQAILAGQKTQTRRVVTPQPALCTHDAWPTNWVVEGCEWHCAVCGNGNRLNPRAKSGVSGINCPMGQPGDRIYVRETWNPDPPCDGTWAYTQWAGCREGQIEGVPKQFRTPEHCMYAASTDAELVWTPSVHMPKWAARIWLEITGVRVERLQQITEADCIAEGAPGGHGSIPGYPYSATPLEHFRHIWKSTGGDWDADPWVWVIDFKTISTTGRPA
nr:hypothetical protein [uncultured Comamonas sp.]